MLQLQVEEVMGNEDNENIMTRLKRWTKQVQYQITGKRHDETEDQEDH